MIMDTLIKGLTHTLYLVLTGDPEVFQITLFTLRVTGTATLISVLIGVPIGLFLAFRVFRGRYLAVSMVNLGMGLPPVVVGLFVSLMLWRSGPLGFLNLQYTPTAVVIAQAIIASPIVTGFTMAAVGQLNPKIRLQILALGASRSQLLWLILKEARLGLLAAVIAGFGGVVSEVGAAMMVGGNIPGLTRTLTTATVMEVSKGNFDISVALSVILLLLAYVITFSLTVLQQKGRY
ncbi:tungstate transport system permease protein [Desulfotomaculum arcticum]|uniref:Tungstate transport system permease protein n=2 Tax=Desulfotruncus TaxID=2867377 RepID=A0A1I2XJF2_9FIRM|nr:tungstate transport system permease protein [Desulfotomaculum arcticum] [Desulfotruncus arcticus DSM 17038]